jgi:predicted AlkP superfamily phosphohydrolase/phosphomutase
MRLPFTKQERADPRVAVIGLDCAEPSLVFERWADRLPNLRRLRERGAYGRLESSIPAITVPAWSCMTTGKDAGTLGVYGFRNRADYSYDGLEVANADAIKEPRLWDLASRADKQSIVLGVPQTYPPRPIKGHLVASFLTPSTDHEYTYPPELRDEIREWIGEYEVDVSDFRTHDKERLLGDIYDGTRKRFEIARRLLDEREWDLFMMVEMGVDRIHHGFWKFMDPEHPLHEPNSTFKDAIRDYYEFVDEEIGTLLDRFDEDTHVLVVSDHGSQRMEGGICLNEWLRREGYLVLKDSPGAAEGPVAFGEVKVDWARTRAWGAGGYYGRLFLNVEGREPHGVVPPEDYEALRDELAARLMEIGDPAGNPIPTSVYKPQEIYERIRGIPPDLMIYFGDLAWRSIGSVGWDGIHVRENDTGPDGANHARQGMFLYSDPSRDLEGRQLDGLELRQIAPTVIKLLGLDVPYDMQAKPISFVR